MQSSTLAIGGLVDDCTPALRPERRALTERRFELRPLDPAADSADLFTVGHQGPGADLLWTYMAYGPFASREAMHQWLVGCAATDDPLFFTVVEQATGRRVGMCSFMSVSPEMRRIEIGHIWYAPPLHGSGISIEVASMLLSEAFERLGYRRVEWKCNALNERSRQAALKLGFVFEGIFRQHMIVKGRNRDTAWFSMVDRDWPAAKAALAQRIS
jgi:RimJ/RimL family protein N-acetyltransferase